MKDNPRKSDLLMIFTRNPVLGKVKKRLAADIGEEAALRLYEFLLQHTFEVTKGLNCDKIVYYSEVIPENDLWEAGNYQKGLQQGKDLGERMENAFKNAFSEAYSKVVIIGSDLYDLQKEDLKKAFLALDNKDVVFGPAQDGGYYLLGMKKMDTGIFRNKDWSTSHVLEQSLEHLDKDWVAFLELRNDIDTLEDLKQHKELEYLLKTKK